MFYIILILVIVILGYNVLLNLSKSKLKFINLVENYSEIIKFVFNQYEITDISENNKYSFLIDLYSVLFFCTVENLEKILSQNQYATFSKEVCSLLTSKEYINNFDIEKKLDLNWNLYFNNSRNILALLENNYKINSISYDIDLLHNNATILLNNIHDTNKFLMSIKII